MLPYRYVLMDVNFRRNVAPAGISVLLVTLKNECRAARTATVIP